MGASSYDVICKAEKRVNKWGNSAKRVDMKSITYPYV